MSCGEWWWYASCGSFTGFGFSLVLGAFLVSTVVWLSNP